MVPFRCHPELVEGPPSTAAIAAIPRRARDDKWALFVVTLSSSKGSPQLQRFATIPRRARDDKWSLFVVTLSSSKGRPQLRRLRRSLDELGMTNGPFSLSP